MLTIIVILTHQNLDKLQAMNHLLHCHYPKFSHHLASSYRLIRYHQYAIHANALLIDMLEMMDASSDNFHFRQYRWTMWLKFYPLHHYPIQSCVKVQQYASSSSSTTCQNVTDDDNE